MKDYNQIEDQFIFNLTEDILLTLEDADVDAEKAAKYLGVGLPTFFDYVNGDCYMSIEEIVRLCYLCGAEIDVVITRNGENVRRNK